MYRDHWSDFHGAQYSMENATAATKQPVTTINYDNVTEWTTLRLKSFPARTSRNVLVQTTARAVIAELNKAYEKYLDETKRIYQSSPGIEHMQVAGAWRLNWKQAHKDDREKVDAQPVWTDGALQEIINISDGLLGENMQLRKNSKAYSDLLAWVKNLAMQEGITAENHDTLLKKIVEAGQLETDDRIRNIATAYLSHRAYVQLNVDREYAEDAKDKQMAGYLFQQYPFCVQYNCPYEEYRKAVDARPAVQALTVNSRYSVNGRSVRTRNEVDALRQQLQAEALKFRLESIDVARGKRDNAVYFAGGVGTVAAVVTTAFSGGFALLPILAGLAVGYATYSAVELAEVTKAEFMTSVAAMAPELEDLIRDIFTQIKEFAVGVKNIALVAVAAAALLLLMRMNGTSFFSVGVETVKKKREGGGKRRLRIKTKK